MKRQLTFAAIAAGLLAAALVFYAAPFQIASRPIAATMPAGALLYLEAKDFAGDLHAWETSQAKHRWLLSPGYEAFVRSHLGLRLEEAWKAVGAAAGFVPDTAVLDSIAGNESGLALYDIGDLEFLYVTRLASARAVETALWQARADYQTRHAGNYDFFVRAREGKVVAFAVADGFLLLATREEFVAAALRLLSGEQLPTIQSEGWYAETTAAARAPGDLRLVMNLESIVKSPHFRSYWIQRNAAEIKTYWAGIVDLRRTPAAISEQRLFLRKNATEPVRAGATDLLRLVPADAAFYQAWAAPDAGDLLALVEHKLLAPKLDAPRSDRYAPPPPADAPPAGTEQDLETRIDEPLLAVQSSIALDALRASLAAMEIRAALQVQSSHVLHDETFVDTPSLVAIEGARDWDPAALRGALSAAAASIWTAANSGAGWREQKHGARTWFDLDGLGRLTFAAQGKLLLIANSADLLAQVMDRIDSNALPGDASFAAGFRHARARGDYKKMMAALDEAQPGAGRQRFFSQNLAGLSDTFADVQSMEIRARDQGKMLQETVTYALRTAP
jgi:hypothetical protein